MQKNMHNRYFIKDVRFLNVIMKKQAQKFELYLYCLNQYIIGCKRKLEY
jgi:hypothetical protein